LTNKTLATIKKIHPVINKNNLDIFNLKKYLVDKLMNIHRGN